MTDTEAVNPFLMQNGVVTGTSLTVDGGRLLV